VLSIKKIALFSIFTLLMANTAYSFSQDYTPQDPNLYEQSVYFDLINIEPSWSDDIQINKEVVIAVLDSGIDLDHPDLIASLWKNTDEIPGDGIDNDNNSYIDDVDGWDFMSSDNNPEPDLTEGYDDVAVNHGTVVAGVIAATANTQGVIGVAPQAKIMPLKILDETGKGNTLVLAQAIDYAVENGADIINLSLVGDSFTDDLNTSIAKAYNSGVMVIAASGNEDEEGISLDTDPRYPVCDIDGINRVFGVAAVDKDLKLTEFSNFGKDCIDISAPGTGFYSTNFQKSSTTDFQTYYSNGWNGTSVATPVISGTAALIKMNFPELRPFDIYSILSSSAQSLQRTNPVHHIDLGAGLVDVGEAINLAYDYANQDIKIILAPQAGLAPEILVMNTKGDLRNSWLAYSEHFTGGVNVVVGDVYGDGPQEVITAPKKGGGPHVRIFDDRGKLLSEFFAYGADFHGGVNIALGDVNNDGINEIITAPGPGGGPHIKVFDSSGNLLTEFFAYEASFDGGVNVATGDVNNDGVAEIVLAPYSGYAPQIKVFDYQRRLKSSFKAFDAGMTSGINISVGDVNSDEWPEIIATPRVNYSPDIKLFSFKGRDKGGFLSYSQYLTTGVEIVSSDITGDGLPEIITLPNKGGAALLKIYDYNGLEKNSFYLRNPEDKNGYNFGILSR
jgi:hypothetical protein